MTEILINIGISFVVSILSTTILLFIYHKKYGIRYNKYNNEFQDLHSLETRVIDIERKIDTYSNDSKKNVVIVASNSPKSNQTNKKFRKEQKSSKEETKSISSLKKDDTSIVQRPTDDSYLFLKVSDGKLVLSDTISYYRAWLFNNVLYYEFYCDKSRIAMVINNRSVLLEPFCRKESSSEDADNATSIVPIKPGTLDKNNYAIIEKTIIKFE